MLHLKLLTIDLPVLIVVAFFNHNSPVAEPTVDIEVMLAVEGIQQK